MSLQNHKRGSSYMLVGNVILNKLLDYFYSYLQPTLVSVFQQFSEIVATNKSIVGQIGAIQQIIMFG
jgi:hypothetical protein